jgi:hypothetical protein
VNAVGTVTGTREVQDGRVAVELVYGTVVVARTQNARRQLHVQ